MRRHSLDLVSMIFGLVFLLVAALWPLWRVGVLDRDSIGWLPATALIAIGLLGLALSITKSRSPNGAPAASSTARLSTEEEEPRDTDPVGDTAEDHGRSAVADTTHDTAYDGEGTGGRGLS